MSRVQGKALKSTVAREGRQTHTIPGQDFSDRKQIWLWELGRGEEGPQKGSKRKPLGDTTAVDILTVVI